MLFPRGKTKFVRPDGTVGSAPGHGIALIGMGEIANAALKRSGLGWLVTLWTPLGTTRAAEFIVIREMPR